MSAELNSKIGAQSGSMDADDEEIRCPPTTHLVATVDDLTDMLDYNSEDIDGMDDDAGEE